MKKLILVILFLVLINLVKAENETYYDLKLEVIVDDEINIETDYDGFFKITYLNHTTGEKERVFVKIYYNITSIAENNSLLKEDIFNVTVNSYTTAKTGNYFFDKEGYYKVCGEIIFSELNESNLENNKACKNFTIISTFNISCNVSLRIETEKLIYDNNEKVSFKNILNNDSFNYKIEYWVEDLFGNVFKKSYITENLNKKSYTPKIDSKVEVLKIISNLTYLACNDTNKTDNYFEALLIVKNKDYKEEEVICSECEEETETKPKTGKTEIEFVELPKKINVGNTEITIFSVNDSKNYNKKQ